MVFSRLWSDLGSYRAVVVGVVIGCVVFIFGIIFRVWIVFYRGRRFRVFYNLIV